MASINPFQPDPLSHSGAGAADEGAASPHASRSALAALPHSPFRDVPSPGVNGAPYSDSALLEAQDSRSALAASARPAPPRRSLSSSSSSSSASLLSDAESGAAFPLRSSRSGSHRPRSVLERIRRRARSIAAVDSRAREDAFGPGTGRAGRGAAVRGMQRKEKALWDWANVEDLDAFLSEVYAYYTGKGIYAIGLSRLLNLLTIAFVMGFTTFLSRCIDYSLIRHDGNLSETVIPHCVARSSGASLLLLLLLGMLYAWQVVQFGAGISRLRAMHAFYEELLEVPDADIASIPWSQIVTRLRNLRDTHPTAISSAGAGAHERSLLDAHSVANRIMRRSNYLIALFNKDLLDLSVPLPGMLNRAPVLTRTMEWNLSFCLLGFVFDRRGQVRKQFMDERYRAQLVEGLKRRFIFMALLNALFAPFIVIAVLVYSFFRYFEVYHQDPKQIGGRQYTRLARWKFREFNELPHLFTRRCHASYPFAHKYIDQFPKERTAIVARFVSFIAGSFMAVLVVASIIDPDLFVHFDISHQRTTLFYIGVFGAILAVARGMVPDDRLVFEPEVIMSTVVEHTHYCPDEWRGRFHSADVHAQFSELYRLKIYIFVQELFSVLITPWVLWRSLPNSAPEIIDFFRQFTVHVDGTGYVCSFAVFARNSNQRFGASANVPEERLSATKDAKMEARMERSLYGFALENPEWRAPPDSSASAFLERVGEAVAAQAQGNGIAGARPTVGGVPISVPGMAARNDALAFSLQAKSQLYESAFARSVANASTPGGGLGARSRQRGASRMQAVEETEPQAPPTAEETQLLDVGGPFMHASDDASALPHGSELGADSASAAARDRAGLQGLVRQAYGGAPGARW